MTEQRNEAIARWMGYRWFSEITTEPRMGPDFTMKPSDRSDAIDGWMPARIPAYDESLDAQVPVWEALPITGIEFAPVADGIDCTVYVGGDRVAGTGATFAEAAARAIHAALVALGEVTE